ncbi:MAG: Ca-activated chloride channel [Acidobacteriota bacterium]|jgi:Ca-activated chloride channel family protein|nr:Ca-activated chloride channel [Acidobacteriota bacterium]
MWTRRSDRLGRVALVSFFFAASFALAAPIASGQPGQKTEPPPAAQKAEQSAGQNAGQQKTGETPTPQDQPPQGQPQPAQKPPVPAANGRASSSNTTPQGPAVGPVVPQLIDDSKPVILHSDLITMTVTVTDTFGRFVTGLGQKAFTVFDDKTEQEITFFSDDDAPVSLGVVFDVSGSMGGDKIQRAREALSKFVDTSHARDEYFLIGFNNRAQLLLDHTRDSDALMQKLTFVQTHGQTALYDACYLGVERVTRGAHPKRAILLISDGQDNSSRYTFTELRRLLKESDVIIYAIGIVSSGDESQLGYGGRAILEELAGVSGGKAFFPSTAAEMNDTFERIALELRTQYSIGYRPTTFANDGKWHKLKIKVQPPRGFPRLFVRGREGYFATATPR